MIALCAQAKSIGKEQKLPQNIAHRGFKAEHPENTLRAFKAAIEDAGAHAIETDIHLSRDNVVILSHVSKIRGDIRLVLTRDRIRT